MKLASAELAGRSFSAEVDGDLLYPLEGLGPLGPDTPFADLASAPRVEEPVRLDEVELLPVVPNPGKIICLGLNYGGHIEETKRDRPSYPVLFTKFSESLVGPRAPIALPPESREVDYEGELAAIVGRPGRRIPASDALDHVAGYAVANDITMRDFQHRTHQWLQGKAWAESTPLGPWLVTVDEVGAADDLELRLTLNGEEMQAANTGLMLFGVAETISIVSQFARLEAGDVLLMGTPAGVGFTRDPQVFLKPGDRVRVSISTLGELDNELRAEHLGP